MGGKGDTEAAPAGPPAYVKKTHKAWLAEIDIDRAAAAADNPYTSAVSYDPSLETDGMLAALNAFCAALAGFHDASVDIDKVADSFDAMYNYITAVNVLTDWQAYIAGAKTTVDGIYLDNAYIADSVNEYSAMLAADIAATVIPKFEAGMRDSNAVMTSSFVIGEALIYAEKDRNVSKYAADLKLQSVLERDKAIVAAGGYMLDADLKTAAIHVSMVKEYADFYIAGIEFKRLLTHMVVDSLRMIIVAKKEQTDMQHELDRAEAMWKMDLWSPCANVLGSYNVNSSATPQGPKGQSALGGALSGAASGAMLGGSVGGPYGAAIGGVIGGIAGLFGSK